MRTRSSNNKKRIIIVHGVDGKELEEEETKVRTHHIPAKKFPRNCRQTRDLRHA